jgi:hypothetical protein
MTATNEQGGARKKMPPLDNKVAAREKVLTETLHRLEELRASSGLERLIRLSENHQLEYLRASGVQTQDDSLFKGTSWHPIEFKMLDVMRAVGFSEATIKKGFPTRSKSAVTAHLQKSKCRFFATEDRSKGVTIIPAPPKGHEHDKAVDVLKHCNKALQTYTVFSQVLAATAENEKDEFQNKREPALIQGMRYSIPLCYLVKIGVISERDSDAVMTMIEERVVLDPGVQKIVAGGTKLSFQKIPALLVTLANSSPQFPHVDAGHNTVYEGVSSQGGTMRQVAISCDDECAPTRIFVVPEDRRVMTPDDLANVLNDMSRITERFKLDGTGERNHGTGKRNHDDYSAVRDLRVTEHLRGFLQQPENAKLIQAFGDLMNSTNVLEEVKMGVLEKAGTIQLMPEGLIHAGPGSEKFRSVLFSSFAPSDVEEYDTDFQMRQDVLCANLVINTFDKLLASDRKILLWHLAFLMCECTANPAAKANKLSLRPHIPDCPHYLDKFIKDVETLYGPKDQNKTNTLHNKTNTLHKKINNLSKKTRLEW